MYVMIGFVLFITHKGAQSHCSETGKGRGRRDYYPLSFQGAR